MSNSVYCDFIYQDSKPNHNKFVIIKGKHGQFIYCERSDKKSFKGLTIGDLKWDLITNDYFDEEWDQLLIRRYDTDMADSYAEAIGDEVELTRLKPRDVIDIVTKADDEIRYSSQDNFTNDLMEKLTELSKDNDLREELSALKASKDTIKTEVNALRDEVMALKDWKGLRERYDKELREEMMALKASKETIETDFCELREELNEMKSSNYFVVIRDKSQSYIYCCRCNQKSLHGVSVKTLKCDLIRNDYFDEKTDELVVTRFAEDLDDRYSEPISDDFLLTRLGQRDVLEITTKSDEDLVPYPLQDGFQTDLDPKSSELLTENNEMKEKLKTLNESKSAMERELREELNALKSSLHNILDQNSKQLSKESNELREKLLTLKASKHAMEREFWDELSAFKSGFHKDLDQKSQELCQENHELRQELVALKSSLHNILDQNSRQLSKESNDLSEELSALKNWKNIKDKRDREMDDEIQYLLMF
ncbi:unnamed protein product [Oppiella nova]|uniref:Uncharacterized protein n=1 Tax=Oppiella nova TaxID=334625 RepID=A0A7R9LS74_9ACAR|nr:unnamed protein product [Oppiella nova]CAG2166446.1 unnamed protein product [Oppiella nova]